MKSEIEKNISFRNWLTRRWALHMTGKAPWSELDDMLHGARMLCSYDDFDLYDELSILRDITDQYHIESLNLNTSRREAVA